jgi:hypothetical protein
MIPEGSQFLKKTFELEGFYFEYFRILTKLTSRPFLGEAFESF